MLEHHVVPVDLAFLDSVSLFLFFFACDDSGSRPPLSFLFLFLFFVCCFVRVAVKRSRMRPRATSAAGPACASHRRQQRLERRRQHQSQKIGPTAGTTASGAAQEAETAPGTVQPTAATATKNPADSGSRTLRTSVGHRHGCHHVTAATAAAFTTQLQRRAFKQQPSAHLCRFTFAFAPRRPSSAGPQLRRG